MCACAYRMTVQDGSPFQCSFLFFLCRFSLLCVLPVPQTFSTPATTLLSIGDQHQIPVSSDFHHTHNITDDIERPPGSPLIVVGSRRRRRRRKERKQKRGRRSSIIQRLRKQPHKPPLPSLYLSNARSLVHKTNAFE